MLLWIFQSTLPARGATCAWRNDGELQGISIHAPRTGSDVMAQMRAFRDLRFQSTLPARGATAGTTAPTATYGQFQSTLPARGATKTSDASSKSSLISIHAPRTGSDMHRACRNLSMTNFNPRSPHGERLEIARECAEYETFQSTLPARGATRSGISGETEPLFQSTLPARGATHRRLTRSR